MSAIPRAAPTPPPPSTRDIAALSKGEGGGATLAWLEGERERFLGPPTKPLSEQAEERLHNRLLDELDRQRLIPSTDLAKLGDDHLLELAGELHAVHVDVRGLELLLARLGDDIVNEAVAFVRVAPPERGLFEAMAPVRAAILARPAAALFAQRDVADKEALARPFVPQPADAWLLRFADVAAPALAAIDDRAARMALAWIAARGRADAVPASHASFIAPFAALSKIDHPWIACLAARSAEGSEASSDPARPRADARARGHEAHVIALLEETNADPAAAALFVARALAGAARSAAAAWLETHRAAVEPVLALASKNGSEDAAVAVALFSGDTTAGDPKLDDVPSAIPALPGFFDAHKLPAPRLQDGTPLDVDAVQALGEMLRFTSLARPYPGIAQVKSACDASSLDDLALAILGKWGDAGEPPTDLWALESAGKIGGDGCAREVARRIRIWAKGAEPPRHAWDDDERRVVMLNEGDRGWAYARAGCQVLAANGSDLALTMLDDLARTGGTTWLRKEARRALDQASEGRNLRPAQLADDIVPTLGLDSEGMTVLDLGSRTFKLTFDEMLVPHLVDDEGAISKAFPRARKDDDAEKTAAAKLRFQSLAKDTKVLARQQVAQLEAAMCSKRSWTVQAFETRFIAHPLLRHIARRLVWAYEDLSKTFRVAEDLTYADENDEALELPKNPGSAVRIILVHPILLTPEARTRWTERFADYELVQPLPQLTRETFTIIDEDHGQHQLASKDGPRGFGAGSVTTRGRLFALSRRGWQVRVENGWVEEYFRVLPAGAHARIGITPGMALGVSASDDTELTLTTISSTYALDRLPAIDYSELVRDVAYLCTN